MASRNSKRDSSALYFLRQDLGVLVADDMVPLGVVICSLLRKVVSYALIV